LTALSEFDKRPIDKNEEGTRLEESMHLFQVIFSKVRFKLTRQNYSNRYSQGFLEYIY
jgi:hypothetical protein